MKTLMFFEYQWKKEDKGRYHCTYSVEPFPILGVSSTSFEEAGKKMIPLLVEECASHTFDKPFYLITNDGRFGRTAATGEQLNSIKSSLENYIQDNKLNIKLEVLDSDSMKGLFN
jgi:hypothetical protein